MLKKSLLEIYALGVCFFFVVWVAIWGAETAWSAVQYAMPEIGLGSVDLGPHKSDDAFRRFLLENHKGDSTYVVPTGAELTREREESWEVTLEASERSDLRQMMQGTIYVVFGLVVFAIHWKMAGKARRDG